MLLSWPVALYVARPYFRGAEDTIEYRGEHFKMSKKYWSYEDYKEDPNKLATNELPRIEHAMVSANIGMSFSSREEFSHAVFRLKFPGYGLISLGDTVSTRAPMQCVLWRVLPKEWRSL